MMPIRIFLYLGVGFLLLIVYVRFVENTSIFLPNRDILTIPTDMGLVFEDVFFDTKDGLKINGWFIKNPSASATLIFLHGNAGNNSYRFEKIRIFHDLGLNIFIIDYRGYGKSEGKPTEQGMYLDALAGYDYLNSRNDSDRQNFIIYGESLGGAAAVDLAAQRQAKALILDSTFTSAEDMARIIMPFAPTFLLKSKLDSVTKVKAINIPKLFIHSPEDEIVPFRLAKKLFQAAAEPKEFLEIEGDHNEGYMLSGKKYVEGLKSFLKKNNIIP
jgi:fermentation-respiration switch protein FrsA (DUF1100 family)